MQHSALVSENALNPLPIIGLSVGDVNGIGIELILKVFNNPSMFHFCTPVVLGSMQVMDFYRKLLSLPVPIQQVRTPQEIKDIKHNKSLLVYECWTDNIAITPAQATEASCKCALQSFEQAVAFLKENILHALVTLPVRKATFPDFMGHTAYLKHYFQASDTLMLMVDEAMRIALFTEHIPHQEVSAHITKEALQNKLQRLKTTLQKDMGIAHPKIAVLGLNPHAGDGGLIGKEDIHIIEPVVQQMQEQGLMVFGPYSADGFFAQGHYAQFDAILAMYHDQGLIPFKSLTQRGVNYTAGLPVIRTSPAHGTAFDIAGKNKADEQSFRAAIFLALDILKERKSVS